MPKRKGSDDAEIEPGGRKPKTRKRWTAEEDDKLRFLIDEQKSRGAEAISWAKAATEIEGRDNKACRLRWCNELQPGTKKRAFTDLENSVILQAHDAWGSRWANMARCLPGRRDNTIKNYWNTKLAKYADIDRDFYTTFISETANETLADLDFIGSMLENFSKMRETLRKPPNNTNKAGTTQVVDLEASKKADIDFLKELYKDLGTIQSEAKELLSSMKAQGEEQPATGPAAAQQTQPSAAKTVAVAETFELPLHQNFPVLGAENQHAGPYAYYDPPEGIPRIRMKKSKKWAMRMVERFTKLEKRRKDRERAGRSLSDSDAVKLEQLNMVVEELQHNHSGLLSQQVPPTKPTPPVQQMNLDGTLPVAAAKPLPPANNMKSVTATKGTIPAKKQHAKNPAAMPGARLPTVSGGEHRVQAAVHVKASCRQVLGGGEMPAQLMEVESDQMLDELFQPSDVTMLLPFIEMSGLLGGDVMEIGETWKQRCQSGENWNAGFKEGFPEVPNSWESRLDLFSRR